MIFRQRTFPTSLEKHYIFLITIGATILYFADAFAFIMHFSLESAPLISTKTLISIGLFYLSVQIYKNQVAYY